MIGHIGVATGYSDPIPIPATMALQRKKFLRRNFTNLKY